MTRYEPDATLAHRLDPRSKLAVQLAFVAAAFAHPTPSGLAALAALALVVARAARLPVLGTLRSYRALAPLLVAGPLLRALTPGPPWLVPADAVAPALAVARVPLLLIVASAYVRSTPVRETRAALQRLLPGRAGATLGLGVGLVARFLPLLRDDLRRSREAVRARLGAERPLHDRMRLVAVAGLRRAFRRADRLALAMRARCLSWNPTLPELCLSRLDAGAFGVALGLLAFAFFGVFDVPF